VDSPGKGRGGGETEFIGTMLAGFDLIWPPDHVVESLSDVFAAEPATSLGVVRIDRLLGVVRCCRIGTIGMRLLIDGRARKMPPLTGVEGGRLLGATDSEYRVSSRACCLLHSDGLDLNAPGLAAALLKGLEKQCLSGTGGPQPYCTMLAHLLLARHRQVHDDAALAVWNWQRA